MVLSYLSPKWFFGIDVVMELSFAVISLLVALLAFSIYKKTSIRSLKLFGISFLLVSISYFVQSILNFLIVSKLNQNVCTLMKLQSVSGFEYLGIFIHIILMTTGLSLLFFTTMNEKSYRMFWFLLIISFSSIFFSGKIVYYFYLISTIYLLFIALHYLKNYMHNKQIKTLLVFIAFIFLLFGSFHFIISVNHQLFYFIGHMLEFFAYLFILINLALVRKR